MHYIASIMVIEKLKATSIQSLINVAQLLREPTGSSRSYSMGEVLNEQSQGLVEGKVVLIHINQGILIRVELATELELVCSRCLNTFICPISCHIEEQFLPVVDVVSGLQLPPSEESTGFTIDSNHILDLGELIRQYILLNLPMKPLCRPDCNGIKEIDLYAATA